MRIAIYVRISTNGEKQDLENQLQPLKEWAARLGDPSPLIFSDEASGSKADRIGLNQALEGAHKRTYDTLLVWALDRLSREGIARMAGYLERLRASGVRVLSHQESWLDTAGPVSDLLIAIFGWVAQQERARLRERTLAGLARAKAQGRGGGRPKRRFDSDRALGLAAQGVPIRRIAQLVGTPRSTVSRFLSQKGRVFSSEKVSNNNGPISPPLG